MPLTLVTPPTTYPVTLEEAKSHLRVDHAFEDSYIQKLIAVATAHFDGWDNILGRALSPQTWMLTYDTFPSGAVDLILKPVISVDEVEYDDVDGNPQVVSPVDYYVDTVNGWLVLNSDASWPSTLDAVNATRITFTAGYADIPGPSETSDPVSGVPIQIQQAILLMVGYFFKNREATPETYVKPISGAAILPVFAAESLIVPFKRWVIA